MVNLIKVNKVIMLLALLPLVGCKEGAVVSEALEQDSVLSSKIDNYIVLDVDVSSKDSVVVSGKKLSSISEAVEAIREFVLVYRSEGAVRFNNAMSSSYDDIAKVLEAYSIANLQVLNEEALAKYNISFDELSELKQQGVARAVSTKLAIN